MDNNIQRGLLKRWNDEKAFGFIKSESSKSDVFIHISALKGMSRRPIVGDTIFFNVQTDQDGKQKAFNARIDGVAQLRPVAQRKNKTENRKTTNPWLVKLLILITLLPITLFIYDKNISDRTIAVEQSFSPIIKKTRTIYNCNGKTYCSEMTSCEEAKFYQNNCPGTLMDGDNDGVPCESQWCSW